MKYRLQTVLLFPVSHSPLGFLWMRKGILYSVVCSPYFSFPATVRISFLPIFSLISMLITINDLSYLFASHVQVVQSDCNNRLGELRSKQLMLCTYKHKLKDITTIDFTSAEIPSPYPSGRQINNSQSPSFQHVLDIPRPMEHLSCWVIHVNQGIIDCSEDLLPN